MLASMSRREDVSSGAHVRVRTLLALAAFIFCLQSVRARTAKASTMYRQMTAPNAIFENKSIKTPAVVVSTAAVEAEPTVQDLYPVEKLHLRDPFIPLGGSSSGFQGGEIVEFSIHNLVLKGIMRDPDGDFALFVDANSGSDYVLRKNTLYDSRNKPVPGVSGIIKPQQKTVHLLTSDQDVQTFILGEERGQE
jgi:hypothetical protein